MERFTQRDSKGQAFCRAKTCYSVVPCTEIVGGEPIARLAELEDKLESGQLVELPCKVGDPIYTVFLDDDDEFKIVETECIGLKIWENEIEIVTNFCCYDQYRYGKFTDKAQAEARLQELQENL